MPHRLKLSELAHMTPAEVQAETRALVEAQEVARAAGSPTLDARIRRFETRFEMSSEEMRRRVAAGEIADTADLMEWLILLAAREGAPGVNGAR